MGRLDRVQIPDALRRNVERHPAGPEWLAGLPQRTARLAHLWGLTLGPPFRSGVAAWTAPARTADGADVVLKLSLPHDEARGEADALRLWAGRGAVRLLDDAPDDWALLLERCRPGSDLLADPAPDDARLRAGAHVLRSLRTTAGDRPPAGLRPMIATCDRGAEVLLRTAARSAGPAAAAGVVTDTGVVDDAAALLRELPRSAGPDAVVHGDLNPGNILRDDRAAERGGTDWLAIDPKPLLGDPAYDPWPLVSQVGRPFAGADPVASLRDRTRLVADVAGLDADRVAAWAFARGVQSAYWYVAESRWEPAAAELADARVWGRLLG